MVDGRTRGRGHEDQQRASSGKTGDVAERVRAAWGRQTGQAAVLREDVQQFLAAVGSSTG